jgi:hypothetical protein
LTTTRIGRWNEAGASPAVAAASVAPGHRKVADEANARTSEPNAPTTAS